MSMNQLLIYIIILRCTFISGQKGTIRVHVNGATSWMNQSLSLLLPTLYRGLSSSLGRDLSIREGNEIGNSAMTMEVMHISKHTA